jgi:hypothetical protein
VGRIYPKAAADDSFVPRLQDQKPHLISPLATKCSAAARSLYSGENSGGSVPLFDGLATKH